MYRLCHFIVFRNDVIPLCVYYRYSLCISLFPRAADANSSAASTAHLSLPPPYAIVPTISPRIVALCCVDRSPNPSR